MVAASSLWGEAYCPRVRQAIKKARLVLQGADRVLAQWSRARSGARASAKVGSTSLRDTGAMRWNAWPHTFV